MAKRVLDVGNCGPDHGALTDVLQASFDVEIVQVHNKSEALAALSESKFDLVTVNRLMDRDGASGLEIIKAVKADDRFSEVPVMLITNYPEYQDQAVALGATLGFGKNDLRADATRNLFKPILS